MSWFMRRPRLKEQPKQTPHHQSTMSDKVMKKMKEDTQPTKPNKTK